MIKKKRNKKGGEFLLNLREISVRVDFEDRLKV